MKHRINDIIVAKNSGFCFGVNRACESLTNAVESDIKDTDIYTLGHLIHNEIFNKRMSDLGVRTIEGDDIGPLFKDQPDRKTKIFIRAHGVTKDLYSKLENLSNTYDSFSHVDCTCPYVKKIQEIAQRSSGENNCFILIGMESHPEVVSILSYFEGEKYVFSSPEKLRDAVASGIIPFESKRIVMASQTTMNKQQWDECSSYARSVFPDPLIHNTVCSVTETRQAEAASLAERCDFMIVIGGKNSSNSKKLYKICKDNCPKTVFVEDASELGKQIPIIHGNVGIVAGASTPGDIIREVFKTMSEIKTNSENFDELLESSFKTLNTGDIVVGIVTSVTKAEIQLDLGAKVTGFIKAEQVSDDPSANLEDLFKIGDEVEAFVIRVSDVDGVATLSKKRVDADRNRLRIVAAKDSGEVLTGKVINTVKGGVIINTDGVSVFVPASQTGVSKDTDLSTLVGETVSYKVIEIKDGGKRAVGSIKVVKREEAKAKREAFWAEIEVGKQYTGVVKNLTSYGAFVDLGGVDGMVHNTELSWKHIKSPAEVVSVGDVITVFVKEFDAEKKRISLGYKTEEENPWYIFTNNYNEGDVVSCEIVNIVEFGAFARIIDGVDGLIRISQIANKRIEKISDHLSVGQVVNAKIKEINTEKQNVSLSIRDLLTEEAEAAEEAEAPVETTEE